MKEEKAQEIVDKMKFVKKSIDPRDPNCLDPNMTLVCLWCGKSFSPYNQMVSNDFAYMAYCSDRHFVLYHKYGKIKDYFENIPRYLIWKPYFAVRNWLCRKDCPYCHKRMLVILPNDIYACMECGRDFVVVKKEDKQ